MKLRIQFEKDINRCLYEDYCRFLFDSIRRDIRENIIPAKYCVREKAILKSSVIKWDGEPPARLNLVVLVTNCLEMKKVYGVYEIRLSTTRVVPGSSTKLSTLIRLLEYGTEGLPALPFIRRIMYAYSQKYKELLLEFMKERLTS